jgi:type I restriction enzyme, S subunit
MTWPSIAFLETIRKSHVGRVNQIPSSEIKPTGRFPVVDQGQCFISGYSDDERRVINSELPLIIFGDHTRVVKFVDFPFILGADGTKVLKPREDMFDARFFSFALLSLDIPSRGYNRHFTLLKERRVPRPELPEQRKIAGVLGLVQRAMEQQERLLALTTELKKGLMHRLFTKGLRGEPQKQTEIGSVPESWRVSRLDNFCVLQRGFDITKKEQVAGNVPVVSSGGIASYHNIAKVKGPGVVVGRKGTLGKVHYLDVDYWPHDTTLWVKDFKEHDPLFTSYFLKTLRFERYNSGASNPTLNRNTVHAELIAFPQKEEQTEIGHIIKTVEDRARVHERKHSTLTALFRTVLHQLMTAQIRVNNIDEEYLICLNADNSHYRKKGE